MRLKQFNVTNFRSVLDSGWIEAEDVTALIGANESGKTNLLAPLWKLNPAREGELAPTSDYPKSMFADIRAKPSKYRFISADFTTEGYTASIAREAGISANEAAVVRVNRYFDGRFEIEFPEHKREKELPGQTLIDLIEKVAGEIKGITPLKTEESVHDALVANVRDLVSDLDPAAKLTAVNFKSAAASVAALMPETVAKTSSIFPRTQQLADELLAIEKRLSTPQPGSRPEVEALVLKRLPKFVYYSNYGNLDSEIYLPHVVENLQRSDLGAKEAAKARTLRVLFKFVTLEPQEILDLGRDYVPGSNGRKPTPEEIDEIAEKKRERSILLQSAGTKLTGKFKDWWKQGDYRFRFDADGDHFRIWVSDDKRPEEIELESRSTGLQWFLSFYLVFLVESEGEHDESILLLDEPGLSLHPLAQRDLSAFFDSLSETNQILYTTHSPFLVHADRLERARKVYVDVDGTTKATPDLRKGSDPKQLGAAYAVHSALNMSVAESLLLGCQPVIVEGPSDQHYLTAIKSLLIGAGKFTPKRELVFPPSGGTKNVRQIAGILSGRDEALPYVVLDGDAPGRKLATELGTSLYINDRDRIVTVDTITNMENSEIEDLFPVEFMAKVVDKWERKPEEDFADVVEPGKPIVDQIEAWANSAGIALELGWKVELAKRVKQQVLAKGAKQFDDDVIDRWVTLFEKISEMPAL
ncbi:MAG: AAA family ATPase [Rhizobiales bacterium]|nr:AAA family ATPase [Hyphomicrobiales bacterium]